MTDPVSAVILDFDGVLIESEYAGNRQIAEYLTDHGHPTTVTDALVQFTGLSGDNLIDAIERWIGGPLPGGFAIARKAEDDRVMRDGIAAVEGAVAFVRGLPPTLPRAIASSSSTAWIARHLDHIGLRDAFGGHLYSGREHVARGKPAPDIYLYAADALGVPIERCGIIEDSIVGVTGAVLSGARVVAFTGASHCGPDHAARLRDAGARTIAATFGDVAFALGLTDQMVSPLSR